MSTHTISCSCSNGSFDKKDRKKFQKEIMIFLDPDVTQTKRNHAAQKIKQFLQHLIVDRKTFIAEKQAVFEEIKSSLGSLDSQEEGTSHTFEACLSETTLEVNNATKELNLLSRALTLVDDGEFGWCQKCGCEIATGRLSAYPYFTTCVECQKKLERKTNTTRVAFV